MGERLIGYMSEGYSLTAAAGKIGMSRSTVYAWAEANPQFSDALNIARAAAAAWWEDRARAIAHGEDGNPSVVIFGLKNRVADEWRDVNRQEITGADGGPVKTEDTTAAEVLKARLDAIANRTAGGASGE